MSKIVKPVVRSRYRRLIGKEYYIFKRWLQWHFSFTSWAKVRETEMCKHTVFDHKSLIMRPLKNVDMYLQENKKTNLKIAVSKLNNTLILPGQTFSFWKLVGRTLKRKGYLEGLILNQGKIDKNIGGGLCQLGNLLFWVFAHSPLTITERHRHSFDVFPDVNRCIPFGAGATLSYNYIDLQVKNNTDTAFMLKLKVGDEFLHGELFSEIRLTSTYRVIEKEHKFSQQTWGGYSRHNRIYRIETNLDGNENEELLVENHALVMYTPFLEAKNNV